MSHEDFDFQKPNYAKIFDRRLKLLQAIREDPSVLPHLKLHYKNNPADFITDWGLTVDPKNVERGLPSVIPFVLFERQAEWVNWVVEHWKGQAPGLTEKTRQMGFSWLSVATACTLCIFNPGMSIGFGSRKEEYVDKIGDPKSLFHKARVFMGGLPKEFRGGWVAEKHSPHMRIVFPQSGATISGEAGDNIGRGNTTSIYFVDEAAFLERPHLVEASLSQTTNCRIDISTPNGIGNPFYDKRHGGKIDVFTFHWRDDPRKDQAWYDKQVAELDAVTVAQEIDIDYAASVEGVVIPTAWVRAAIDAHVKLGIKPTGARTASLDVADEGADKNGFVGGHGILLEQAFEWSGKESDIYGTTEKAFNHCDTGNYEGFKFDSDGLGAGVRGDARVINEGRRKLGQSQLSVEPFRGSEAVFNPEGEDVKGRKNKDYFANRKAQSWWALRTRFHKTYQAVIEGKDFQADELISLSKNCVNLTKIVAELSQPTYSVNAIGKLLVDKAPDGTKSPNLADAVMIQFSTTKRRPMKISQSLLQKI